MKKLFILTFMLSLAFGAQAQRSVWIELTDSGLDTLTGVAADSITVSANLNKKFGGGLFGGSQVLTARYVLLETDVVADINSGEGLTSRVEFGGTTGFRTAAKDTQFTAPGAPSGVVFDLYDMRSASYAGTRIVVYNQAYASAADTDSLSYRQRVYGLFEVN